MIKRLLLVAVILVVCSNLVPQDWNQFRGPGRDGKVSGFEDPVTWPSKLEQMWKYSVGKGDATPVMAGDNLYLHTRQGNEEVVLCMNASTGRELWRYSYVAPEVTGPSSSHPGPRSTPVVEEGRVLTLGVAGTLSCLDAGNGNLLWQKEDTLFPEPQFFGAISPLVEDGLVIVQQGGKDKGYVLAYELNSGNEIWRYEGEGPAYGSPSVHFLDNVKQLILITEKSLVSLHFNTGKLLWRADATTQERFFNAVSPVIHDRIVYYTGSGTGTKAVEIGRECGEYKIKGKWYNNTEGAKFCTPVLKDGFLYGFSDQRKIYCLDAATGQAVWKDEANNSDFATIVDCGTVLIGLTNTGNFIVFKADPAAYTEIARYKVSESPVYAFPVIAGNLVYIKDSEHLILYKMK